MAHSENHRYIVQVYVGALSPHYEALSVEASKQTSSEEIVCCITDKLGLTNGSGGPYELAEVVGDMLSGECKERRLGPNESPVAVMLLWPNNTGSGQYNRFYLREKIPDEPWMENFSVDPQLIKDYFQRFLYQPKDREYPDLCQLPELNEQTLLDNLRARFSAGYIYTYVGSILIALNPFKFYPIYNPKYVKLYQNKRIGSSLPPHIFAVADAAYHCMLRERTNQCIVISGESGSGKTESTNFLLHHLTALSQKGSHGSGVEQTILSAGPVLEAFGNAKTAHNNNSSRFGKFIQVNYKENGMVHGAVVQKYLLEKSRICSQGRNERNYHVFYYLLAGASEQEKEQLHLLSVDKYNYLSRTGCSEVPGIDEQYEFSRLKQSMEMVGFTMDKQRRLFAVLSAVLLLGNVKFQPQRKSYHHDEAVGVQNPEVVSLISSLLRVKQETLLAALTSKRARASGETLVINYRLPEAIATRDAMAKCLYGALFDWIVMQVNHALLSKKDTLREHQGHSIGVLDIFGFEDFGLSNSFEQLCINYANEHLQHYFNQHVFKYEQEEYKREGIPWTDIGFSDNTGCLQLIEGKVNGLLCLLDDQCNFPWATNETLLQKFNSVHENNPFYEKPQRREPAFVVRHYAGRVKYQVTAMREKNLDLMRQDIVSVLKNSSLAFVRELVGVDPVAVFRWAIVRAFFRGYFAFLEAGRRHRVHRVDGSSRVPRASIHAPNDSIIRTPHRAASKARETPGRANADTKLRSETPSAAPAGGKGTKNYRIAETRTRRVDRERDERTFDDTDVMQRASQIVMKNKSFRPRERAKKGLKNLQSVKTLAGRTAAPAGKRKQPQTVAAQFQHSLSALMDTLNQANPFFIRCIKSNGEKVPHVFDDDTVQRQLRYTGMLETVRIRQAGYNVRLTYEEFIQLYRILLPKGLLSSQTDVRHFLATLNLDRDNYQLGATKIFMRESEQTKLEYRLHQQIMASIITIQRWFRAVLERRRFLALRRASVVIQYFCRQWLQARQEAAIRLQAWYRGTRVRRWFSRLRRGLVGFQAAARGHLLRRAITGRRASGDSEHDGRAPAPADNNVTLRIAKKDPLYILRTDLENSRQLRATQSLPIPRVEKKREIIIDALETTNAIQKAKKRVTKTDVPLKQTSTTTSFIPKETSECSPEDERWSVTTNRYPQAAVTLPNKITTEDLADELLWLRLDQNYLMTEKDAITKKREKREKELAELLESITSSSEEYLRQIGNWNPSDSTETAKITTRRGSAAVYQRSVSSATLEGRALQSLPPVRRDPRAAPPAPPAPAAPPADAGTVQFQGFLVPSATLEGRALQSLPPVRRDPRAAPPAPPAPAAPPADAGTVQFQGFLVPSATLEGRALQSLPPVRRDPRAAPPAPPAPAAPPADAGTVQFQGFLVPSATLEGRALQSLPPVRRDPRAAPPAPPAPAAPPADAGTVQFQGFLVPSATLEGRALQSLPPVRRDPRAAPPAPPAPAAPPADAGTVQFQGFLVPSATLEGRALQSLPPVRRDPRAAPPAPPAPAAPPADAGTVQFQGFLVPSATLEGRALQSLPPVRRDPRAAPPAPPAPAAPPADAGTVQFQGFLVPSATLEGRALQSLPPVRRDPRAAPPAPPAPAAPPADAGTVQFQGFLVPSATLEGRALQSLPPVRRDPRAAPPAPPAPAAPPADAGTVQFQGFLVPSATLEGRALQSLPPVRRDPRAAPPAPPAPAAPPADAAGSAESVARPEPRAPAPPARSARRSPRRSSRGPPPDIIVDASLSLHDHDIKRAASDQIGGLVVSVVPSAAVVSAAALRRRNSDPAPGDVRPLDPRSTDFIGQTGNGLFRIAGHRFRKGTRFAKGDKCVYCHQAIDAFITQGQRCIDCKQLYHTKCIQNKGVITMPCSSPVTVASRGRPKNRKRIISNSNYNLLDNSKGSVSSNFNLTGTSEFMDRTDKIISDATELQAMQNFITEKIYEMEPNEKKKQSEVDRVFKHALLEFKDNLVATYSIVETRGSSLKYKDLIGNFLHVMETVCAREGSTLSITMGVNAFRGFMDEFMSQHETDKARTKRKKDKRKKVDDPIQYKGHTFILSMINIPTECEICKTFFMWPIERSLICQTCKLASHKKCYTKVSTLCRKDNQTPSAAIVGAVDSGGREQMGVVSRGKVFGVPLPDLPTGETNIPIVVDRLITTIEMTGLYTEGLYRKSGLSSKVRELRRLLDESPEEGADKLDAYAVHVRASVLKTFFRELPEPLLTFDLYDDFILASQISDPQERVSTIFTILRKLPKPNFDLVERLIFHLARVALGENHNRMGPNALAIVFAPCILRTHKIQPAQDSLHDIARQTACLEAILVDKMRTVRGMLQDIATLDTACHTATSRLSTLRSHSHAPRPEEQILVGHIHEIQKEKAILTSNLPTLIRATSDDDLLSTTDHDGELGSTDDLSTGASSMRSQRLLHRQLSSDDPIMV